MKNSLRCPHCQYEVGVMKGEKNTNTESYSVCQACGEVGICITSPEKYTLRKLSWSQLTTLCEDKDTLQFLQETISLIRFGYRQQGLKNWPGSSKPLDPEVTCPCCDVSIESFTKVSTRGGGVTPFPGSISMCDQCGGISIYDGTITNLHLRTLTATESVDLAENKAMYKLLIESRNAMLEAHRKVGRKGFPNKIKR